MASPQFSPGSLATFVAGTALLVLYAVVILHAAFKGKWLAAVRSRLGACRTATWGAPQNDMSDMDRAVHKKMQETGLANFSMVNGLFVHVIPVFFVGFVFELHNDRCGYTSDAQDSTTCWPFRPAESWPVVAVQLTGAAMILILHVLPKLIRPSTLRLWQSMYFLVSFATILPGVCPDRRLSSVSRINGLVLMASNCALLHVPTTVVQHCIYMITIVVRNSATSTHVQDLLHNIGTEAIAAIVSCLCVVVMQHLVEAQHRSNLEASCLAEKQLANTKLLSVFYEVVVEVDATLAIVSSDPDLGLFLPHGAGCPIPTLLGTKLDDLLPDGQDRQLFLQHTRFSPIGEESRVDVMHLKMGYSGNDALNVELFSLRFCGLLGSERHLLAIREFGDEDPRLEGACMTLRVDAFDADYTIVDISETLEIELGAAPGTSLCHLVENAQELKRQLQYSFNTLAFDDGLEPSHSFKVMLRPRGQRTRLLADCCVSLDAAQDGDPETKYLRVSFSNLAPLRSASALSLSSGSSRGSPGAGRVRGTPRQVHSRSLVPSPRRATTALSL